MPELAHAKYVRLKGFVEVGVPLPSMGGHNICLGWSRPSCRQCRTSGAGTVEKEGRKKTKTWIWRSGTCVCDTPSTAPRGHAEKQQRMRHCRVPSAPGRKARITTLLIDLHVAPCKTHFTVCLNYLQPLCIPPPPQKKPLNELQNVQNAVDCVQFTLCSLKFVQYSN